MKLKFLLFLFLTLLSQFVTGQNVANTEPGSLKNGLYVKGIDMLIPWNTSLEDIHNYGNPKIAEFRRNYTEASWEKVELINGITVNLIAYYYNTPGKRRLKHFYSYIDSNDIPIIKDHLESYLNMRGALKGVKKDTFFYEWKLHGCLIRLGHFKKGKSYLWIRKQP